MRCQRSFPRQMVHFWPLRSIYQRHRWPMRLKQSRKSFEKNRKTLAHIDAIFYMHSTQWWPKKKLNVKFYCLNSRKKVTSNYRILWIDHSDSFVSSAFYHLHMAVIVMWKKNYFRHYCNDNEHRLIRVSKRMSKFWKLQPNAELAYRLSFRIILVTAV